MMSRSAALKAPALVYRKFKLPLETSRLTDNRVAAEFSRIVRHAADATGVPFFEPVLPEPSRRSVVFYDTSEFDLYRNNFILRTRKPLEPNSKPEDLVFKFRHADRHLVESVDPRPIAEIPHILRFKEQILPITDGEPGLKRIFWYGCKIFARCALENVSYTSIADIFPVLRRLDVNPGARLTPVNGVIVDESLVQIGRLTLAEGVVAKALISLWRIASDRRSSLGEFSFQIKYHPRRSGVEEIRSRSEAFYLELLARAAGLTAAGGTKVHGLYSLADSRENFHPAAG